MNRYQYLALVLCLPLVAACLDTDLTLQSDGRVTGDLVWTLQSGGGEESVRNALKADGVTVTKVVVKEGPASTAAGAPKVRRATATIDAKSVGALASVPLLKLLGVTASLGEPAGASRTLTVKVANTSKMKPTPPVTDNVVRLHLPGDVTKTSAKAEGKDVTWTIPGLDYYDKPTLELSVVYASSGS